MQIRDKLGYKWVSTSSSRLAYLRVVHTDTPHYYAFDRQLLEHSYPFELMALRHMFWPLAGRPRGDLLVFPMYNAEPKRAELPRDNPMALSQSMQIGVSGQKDFCASLSSNYRIVL